MLKSLNRRQFGLGASALLLGSGLASTSRGQGATKTVTTPLGTYDIPLNPKRVVTIDPRTDYEPAVVLGLPVIGLGHSTYWDGRDYAPVTEGAALIEVPTSAEAVLAFEPDLIICSGEDPDGSWWPARIMQKVAPVLTTTFTRHWRDDLIELAGWLDRQEPAAKAIASYDAAVAAMKQKHAELLARDKVAVVTYNAELRSFAAFVPGGDYSDPKDALLTDLGARTLDTSQLADGGFSMENLGVTLGDVDAIMLCNMGQGGLTELASDTLWTRLPAVAAGRVYEAAGYSWYGSYYTAINALEKFDALFSLS